MPTRPPYGNLTAALAAVALLELIVDRLLGRLFVTPMCHSIPGCLVMRAGPFLLYLTGVLALVVVAGGIAGHLGRGELFPRGVRFTVAALSLVFLLLAGLSLVFGQTPPRYETHLETSFGFVMALVTLSFAGLRQVSARNRIGLALFTLPALFHVAALVASRAGWLGAGWLSPERLIALGEGALLLAAAAAPLLLLPAGVARNQVVTAVALGAGIGAFFFVALIGRPDLVQTVGLYTVHLDLPRGLSPWGLGYLVALFGFTVALAVLLLGPGASRLTGLGLALVGMGGYQTASPVELSLTLAGMLALGSGLSRMGLGGGGSAAGARLSAGAWRAMLGAIAAGIADAPPVGGPPVVIEVVAGNEDGADNAVVRAARRGRSIALEVRRAQSAVRDLKVTVGEPPEAPPDATIESHEAWFSRRPEDRPVASRIKTGDPTFDRKLGVYGHAPLGDQAVRRRVLACADGTITLWAGTAARFVAATGAESGRHRFMLPAGGPGTAKPIVALIDTLAALVQASEAPSPTPPTPSPALS